MQTTRRLLTMAHNPYWSFPNIQLCRNNYNKSTASCKSKVCKKINIYHLFSFNSLSHLCFHTYLIHFLHLYSYGICIRNEANYCCIQYALCSDSNSYSLDNVNAAAKQDSECSEDFIEIDPNRLHLDNIDLLEQH